MRDWSEVARKAKSDPRKATEPRPGPHSTRSEYAKDAADFRQSSVAWIGSNLHKSPALHGVPSPVLAFFDGPALYLRLLGNAITRGIAPGPVHSRHVRQICKRKAPDCRVVRGGGTIGSLPPASCRARGYRTTRSAHPRNARRRSPRRPSNCRLASKHEFERYQSTETIPNAPAPAVPSKSASNEFQVV